MSRSILQTVKRILLLTFVAVSGATISGCMYGPGPAYEGSAHLKIDGKVTSTDGKPISGIHVTVRDQNPDNQWPDVVSDLSGDFHFNRYRSLDGEKVTITATDEDGPANGGDFATISKSIDAPPAVDGDTSSFIIDFTLDPKP